MRPFGLPRGRPMLASERITVVRQTLERITNESLALRQLLELVPGFLWENMDIIDTVDDQLRDLRETADDIADELE